MRTYIFACDAGTMPECLSKRLFGVNKSYVSDISQGDFCYLYNFSEPKILYGLWKATTGCAWHDKQAWGGKYRRQVRVELVSKTLQGFPFYTVKKLIEISPNNITWKLYGEKAQNLLQYFASKYSSEVLFGLQLKPLEEDYRRKYPKQFMCEDGHEVRSLSEKTIDDWLYRHKIYHAYEPVIQIPELIIPDFMVNTLTGEGVYIEFWGRLDDPIYRERMNKKYQIYARHHFPFIEILPEDLQSLDWNFKQKLERKGIPLSS